MAQGGSSSIPTPLPRSNDEIATEVSTTKHSDSVADTPASSATAIAPAAQPFDDHELLFIDSIFGGEDNAPDEDPIDKERKKKS